MLSMSKEVPWYLVIDSLSLSLCPWGCIFVCGSVSQVYFALIVLLKDVDFHLKFKFWLTLFLGGSLVHLSGWWNWSCICGGGSKCIRFCTTSWKWGFWRVRKIPGTWNIRLSPRPKGMPCSPIYPFVLEDTSKILGQLMWWRLHFLDAWSQANWTSTSNWDFLDCCWWGMSTRI